MGVGSSSIAGFCRDFICCDFKNVCGFFVWVDKVEYKLGLIVGIGMQCGYCSYVHVVFDSKNSL